MKRAALAVLAATLAAAPARAQQLMAWPMGAGPNVWHAMLPQPRNPFPEPRPGPRPTPWTQPRIANFPTEAAPLAVSGEQLTGTVTDRVAELTYRITFHNPGDRRLEGMLTVPIPAETALSGFSMKVGGKETKGELLEAGQAASIYESIVHQLRDPGLLELVGERAFRARVFPIEPRSDVTAVLTLTQTLPEERGMISLRANLIHNAAAGSLPDGNALARIEIHSTRPLRSLFSPNPDVHLERLGEREAVVNYQEGAGGRQELAVSFSLSQDPLSAGVLAHREQGEDGTFLLSLSPKAADAAAKPFPKDVVFVLDRSGSMSEDGKIEQARKALSYCVSRLGPEDRFGVVDFATDWNALEERLLTATPANKARARRYIEGLEAAGGTNIESALEEALKLLAVHDGRVPMIFFVTDGVPTSGQTDVNALLSKVAAENSAVKARLFSFGVGSDVNTLLLDKLADGGRGARDYVAPGEDIEAKVSALYQKVSRPALTDVRVEWQGLETADVYPRPVPDLFHGSELTLYGRYKKGGRGTLVVTGKSAGREVRFSYPVELPEEEARNSSLPRLWAGQKIGRELDAVRLSGRPADAESVASIVKLAKKYGIVTPYTSFLVTEEGADRNVVREQSLRSFGALSSAASSSGFSGGAAMAKSARMDSLAIRGMSGGIGSDGAAPAAALKGFESQARADLAGQGRTAVETRTIGDKTFYKRGKVWVDADTEDEAAGAVKTLSLKARGAEYFELLTKEPGLARCLALGDDVTVLWGGTVYKIAAE